MVDALIRQGAIRDERVESAFRAVPRHWFLPGVAPEDAYRDLAIVTLRDNEGVPISSSSQPSLMARMLEQLAVEPASAVLEIGTGTGYNAALLGHLVGPRGTVVTLDVDPAITAAAGRHLADAGATNVMVRAGDGWSTSGPGAVFDRIEATVGVWDLAQGWVEQLRPDGVLVVPLWLRAGQQTSVAFRKVGGALLGQDVEPCGFMRMRGPGAGTPTYRQAGRWTVSLDRASPDTVRALAELLRTEASVRPAPTLERGWFTSIALGEPGAVHLFAEDPDGPVIRAGLLSLDRASLAVVESRPLATPPVDDRIRSYGSEDALVRLLDLVRRRPAVDPGHLVIVATPTGTESDRRRALATLVRPNFTFVVRRVAGGGGGRPTIRRADAADADGVADLFVRCRRHAVPHIPPLAAPADKARAWLAGVVRQGGEVWVAEAEPGVVAFMLLEGGWIEQLYVDPSWTGRGIGTTLVDVAKACRPGGLQLWTFASNGGAHRFYERHGFVAEERTDGRANQERAPDVRYVWHGR